MTGESVSYLGMPLERALDDLRARGNPEPEIVFTRAPRGACEGGTPRVVREQEGGARLTAARFPDRVSEGEGAV